jgi:hypothetical protein
MFHLTRTVHVLALGLWFGTVIFFAVVAFSLFSSFEGLGERVEHRPPWFPLPKAYDTPGKSLPEGWAKEQGTRAAGFAVAPLFDWYFMLQSICGAAALVTALSWARLHAKVPLIHKARVVVLLVAVAGVALGWWLEQKVGELTKPRNDASDAVLATADPTPEQLEKAKAERAEFGRWHGYSMMVNLVTMLAVSVAMALVAYLPPSDAPSPQTGGARIP